MHAVVNLTITDPEAAERHYTSNSCLVCLRRPDSSRGTGPPKAALRFRCSCSRPRPLPPKMSELAIAAVPDGVVLEEIDVREVVAHA